jgi:hypothetical protein
MDNIPRLCLLPSNTSRSFTRGQLVNISHLSDLGKFISSLINSVLIIKDFIITKNAHSEYESITGFVDDKTSQLFQNVGLYRLQIHLEYVSGSEIIQPLGTRFSVLMDIYRDSSTLIPLTATFSVPDETFRKRCTTANTNDVILTCQISDSYDVNMPKFLNALQCYYHPCGHIETGKLVLKTPAINQVIYSPTNDHRIDLILTVDVGELDWVSDQIRGSNTVIQFNKQLSSDHNVILKVWSTLCIHETLSVESVINLGSSQAQFLVDPVGPKIKPILSKMFQHAYIYTSERVKIDCTKRFNINIEYIQKKILSIDALLLLDINIVNDLWITSEHRISLPHFSYSTSSIENADLIFVNLIQRDIIVPKSLTQLKMVDPSFNIGHGGSTYEVTADTSTPLSFVNDFEIYDAGFSFVYDTKGTNQEIKLGNDNFYCEYNFIHREWILEYRVTSLKYDQFSLFFSQVVRERLQDLMYDITLLDVDIRGELLKEVSILTANISNAKMSGCFRYEESLDCKYGMIQITASTSDLEDFCSQVEGFEITFNLSQTEVTLCPQVSDISMLV